MQGYYRHKQLAIFEMETKNGQIKIHYLGLLVRFPEVLWDFFCQGQVCQATLGDGIYFGVTPAT